MIFALYHGPADGEPAGAAGVAECRGAPGPPNVELEILNVVNLPRRFPLAPQMLMAICSSLSFRDCLLCVNQVDSAVFRRTEVPLSPAYPAARTEAVEAEPTASYATLISGLLDPVL
jgi:hypothetical protein